MGPDSDFGQYSNKNLVILLNKASSDRQLKKIEFATVQNVFAARIFLL